MMLQSSIKEKTIGSWVTIRDASCWCSLRVV